MRILIILIFFLCCFFKLSSQQYIVYGTVSDSISKEKLVGASVIINNNGIVTDINGKFVITVNKGMCLLKSSYLGYDPVNTSFLLQNDTSLEILLSPVSVKLNEATIKYVRNDNANNVLPGMIELTRKEIKMLPSFMGEHDILRTLQYMPGVKTVTEGDMGIYIRGGGPDQNLILLDDAPIYNPTHVLGFFSVFNEDIIENVKFYKSGIPATYGNRLSSVIDIQSTQNIPEKNNIKGSIGLISSKIHGSFPFQNNKGSIIIAARRSYIDEVIKPVLNTFIKNTKSAFYNSTYSFYDVNFKAFYKAGGKDRVSFSFYQGRDDFDMNKLSIDYKNDFFWGNRASSFNWSHIFSDNAYIENIIYYSQYNFQFFAGQDGIRIGLYSGVEDIGYKSLLTKNTNKGDIFKIGIDYQRHLFRPNNLNALVNNYNLKFSPNKRLYSHEASIFATRELKFTDKLSMEAGLRLTGYAYTGPYDEYLKNAIGEISDTVHYKKGEILGNYYFPEPHIALRYKTDSMSSVKFSFLYNCQYTHLVSSSAVTMPLDTWMPSNKNVKPQKGIQFSLGYFRDFRKKTISSYADIYYKELYNQIELTHGMVSSYADNLLEESMVFGKGKSYGVEFFLQKKEGRLTGWFGYTLSRSERKFQFDKNSDNMIYPAKYDRRHDIKMVGSYMLSKKFSVDGSFIFSSGNAMTLPDQVCLVEGNLINLYGKTNSFRLPAYHRLDLSFTYTAKKTSRYESVWTFSLFNVYNRPNIFYIYFERTVDLDKKIYSSRTKQVSIFPFMPSITWSFKFNQE